MSDNQTTKVVSFLDTISKLDSQVLRGLLGALLTLIIAIVGLFGVVNVQDIMSNGEKIISGIIGALAAFSIFWAAWHRLTSPNPPLTQTALDKAVEKVSDGTLKTTRVLVTPATVEPDISSNTVESIKTSGGTG